jgi:cytochrome c oxidase assembly protein subunit 15
MKGNEASKWVFRFTVITVFFTFCLIGLGGLVTSKGVGLAVHDWPTSFGYNMFLLPIDQWLGKFGVFEEHSHRLLASIVGLMTAVLASWLWVQEAKGKPRIIALMSILVTLGLMGVRTQAIFVIMAIAAVLIIVFSVYKIIKNPNAMRWLATMAYSMVIVQGVLGGLRVTQQNNQIGIIHGTLAQAFLVVLALIALFCSNWWRKTRVANNPDERVPRVVRAHFLYATILVLLQLVIGASMRHQHAGLAAWDFPKAHGQWWPATDQDSMARYNQGRAELQKKLYEDRKAFDSEGRPVIFLHSFREIQPGQITLHMIHRLIAILILGLVFGTIMVARKKLGGGHLLTKLALFWLGLVLVQILLGALTVLKYKPADIATMHVLFGSLTLITGALGVVICRNLHLPSLNEDSNGRDATKIEQVETAG